ncbi:hypothetical protein [Larkinella knui]|uniref:hypothetical protein n=1 Tax=Larkinella knui TaxID=2025310 RepID=UPI001C8A08C9|nr:hypothetical protein [Larkinella knui]
MKVIQSDWVKSLIEDFEYNDSDPKDESNTVWTEFDVTSAIPLPRIFAVDGSWVPVSSDNYPKKEVAFVKTALMCIDKTKLDKIDHENPHPLLLQDVLNGSALFHTTVFPLKNVKTPLGNNYTAVRHIIRDSIKVDQDGAYYETLKWLTYSKWGTGKPKSPAFECPHCSQVIPGLPYDADEALCASCKESVFLTDMIGFHLDMEDESASTTVPNTYMLIMETLMLLTAVRIFWNKQDKRLVSSCLFIKDGPLSLNSQYSKLVPALRDFFEHAKNVGRPVHLIGQEKTGAFADHLASIARFASPQHQDDPMTYSVLSHKYVRKEVYRQPDLANPYGSRTNWGEKLYVKLEPSWYAVLNIPPGLYNDNTNFPTSNDLIGLSRILATLPSLISRKYEGALYPIELANGIASMSSYPSAKVLQLFAKL